MRRVNEIAGFVDSAPRLQAGGLGSWMESLCWPGGTGDTLRPITAEWLARWHLARTTDVQHMPDCGCADGHCLICN
jgi:hypothetical protein